MDDVFLRLEEELRAGRPAALLTVVESHGATPRGAGSRQLVLASGDTVGTIGGGIRPARRRDGFCRTVFPRCWHMI